MKDNQEPLNLLPCPFCGKQPTTFNSQLHGEAVMCENVGCSIYCNDMTIIKWQSRPTPSQPKRWAASELLDLWYGHGASSNVPESVWDRRWQRLADAINEQI